MSKSHQVILQWTLKCASKDFRNQDKPRVNSNNLGPSAGSPSHPEVGTDPATAADGGWPLTHKRFKPLPAACLRGASLWTGAGLVFLWPSGISAGSKSTGCIRLLPCQIDNPNMIPICPNLVLIPRPSQYVQIW